jgi:hypothetical protein
LYTHDGASAEFSNNSHETDNSVRSLKGLQIRAQGISPTDMDGHNFRYDSTGGYGYSTQEPGYLYSPDSSYGFGGYGSDGYRSGGYGSDGYRSGGYGSDGYRSGGYGSDGYRSGGYGSNGYRSGDYGSADYGSGGYGSDGYRSGGYESAGYGTGG